MGQAGKQDLPRWRRISYGIGDFGFNLYWATASLFLLFFYTDVLGIPSQTAGFIFLIAMVWDGVTDPVMGYIAERTRTRWGSYRPYILLGAVPLAISLVLMFYDPGTSGAALAIYAAATHILFRTVYTILSIPFSSLSARMTRSSAVRNELAAYRMMAATIGGLFVAFSTLRLVAYFGDGDAATGFYWTAMLYAALSLPVFLFLFLTTKEPEIDVAADVMPLSLKAALGALTENKPFLLVFGATMLVMAASVLTSKTLIYYYKYALGDEQASGTALALMAGGAAIFVPIWAVIASKTSKRFVWSTGIAISVVVALVLYFNTRETVPVVTALFAIGSIGAAAGYLSFWSTLPDTVEFGQWRTGVRSESLVFGLMSFAQKVSFGLAAALLGVLLGSIGYTPNVEQSPTTLSGLKFIMTALPAMFLAAAFLLVRAYPIDAKLHGRIGRVLERRERRAAKGMT